MILSPIEPAEAHALSSNDGPARLPDLEPPSTEGTDPLSSFGSVLGQTLGQANQLDFAATQKVEALASGAIDDLHGTMISVKEADIAIKLVGTVRSKILDAFQELWRTSV